MQPPSPSLLLVYHSLKWVSPEFLVLFCKTNERTTQEEFAFVKSLSCTLQAPLEQSRFSIEAQRLSRFLQSGAACRTAGTTAQPPAAAPLWFWKAEPHAPTGWGWPGELQPTAPARRVCTGTGCKGQNRPWSTARDQSAVATRGSAEPLPTVGRQSF